MEEQAFISIALPDRIGPYRVLRPIARGGMAEVYEVEEMASGEHLALKLLMQQGSALKRFNIEYEAMIRLNHPNIVRVYHYGFFDERPWLTMELIEGTPVQAYVKDVGKPGSEVRNREVVRIGRDLAMALDHIHRRGLIHRDLKSANVLVLPDGRVKLLDFGTARVHDAMEAVTKDGEFVGTFAYASPEQLTSKPVDHRSDLYSLGVLLYRLATGKRPFEADDLQTLAKLHVKTKPKTTRELVSDIPVELDAIIMNLLEKVVADRPESGGVVAERLEALAKGSLDLPGTLDVHGSTEALIGREAQLAELKAFVELSRPASFALVVGPDGSGRPQTMAAVDRLARDRKIRTISATFDGGDDMRPLAAMIRDLVRSFGRNPPASLEGADNEATRAMDGNVMAAQSRRELLRDVGARALAERGKADKAPVVVLLRALHHAGAAAFEVLVSWRESLRSHEPTVLFVGDILETGDDPQSLSQKRLPDAHRVQIGPLGPREVALMVGNMLHRRPPPTGIAQRIHRASGGLPLYVEEVVKHMVAGGILQVQGRDPNRIEWAERENIDIPVPASARENVIHGLRLLPFDRRRVLEAIAVAGGDAPVGLIGTALECTVPEIEFALGDLRDQGWITLAEEGGRQVAKWRQLLAEDVVLGELHPSRKDVLTRLIVAQMLDEPVSAVQIQLLRQVRRYDDAVQRALVWCAFHLNQSLPLTALSVLDAVVLIVDETVDTSDFDKARLFLLHAQCLLQARPTDPQTAKSFARAVKLAGRAHEEFQAEIELVRAQIQRVIGHYPNFQKHLKLAWTLIAHESASRLQSSIAGQLGWIHHQFGQLDDAAMWHGRARRVGITLEDAQLQAEADVGVAAWQLAQGKLFDAERQAAISVQVFDEAGDMRGLSLALPVWANSLRHQARFSDALKVLYQQLPIVRAYESPTLYVRLLLATAWLEVEICRLGRAQECVDELGATLRRGEHLHLRLEANLVWGRILLSSGQLYEARVMLADVAQRAKSAQLVLLQEQANALLGETEVALGDINAGTALLDNAIAYLRRTKDVPMLAEAMMARARALGPSLAPASVFEGIDDFVTGEGRLARMEALLVKARRAAQDGQGLAEATAQAEALLQDMSRQQNDTDQAALRVHPWSRTLRMTRPRVGVA